MRYFRIEEFTCSETGENEMNDQFLELLDLMRHECGFAFHVNSGFRSVQHSAEVEKEEPGMHTKGLAADIRVEGGAQRYLLVAEAIRHGMGGIGVADTYVHVDLRPGVAMAWVY